MDFGAPLRWVVVPFVYFPPLAFVPAFIFITVWFKFRSKSASSTNPAIRNRTSVLFAGVMWACYGLYEIRMYFWSQTVHAPIRIDLLIIALVLFLVSVIAVFNSIRWHRSLSELLPA